MQEALDSVLGGKSALREGSSSHTQYSLSPGEQLEESLHRVGKIRWRRKAYPSYHSLEILMVNSPMGSGSSWIMTETAFCFQTQPSHFSVAASAARPS